MKKIIHPCDAPIYNGKKWPVFCEIEFTDGKLSISGVHGPLQSGNAMGGCGQIDSEFAHPYKSQDDARTNNLIKVSDLRFAPGWDKAKWNKFLTIWDLYHLNDLSPACEHQRMMGWDKERIDPTRPSSDYDKFDGHRSTWNLKGWVYPPLGYLAAPCPICGYKYGTEWKRTEVPQDVIDFLFSLPDTDRKPAWV